MRILRIYRRLPPIKGGMEQHIFQLTTKQIENGHLVKVFFNDGHKITDHDEKLVSISLIRVKPQALAIVLFYLAIMWRIIQKNEKFDVIHIHGDWSSLLFCKTLKKMTSARILVFSIHGQLSKRFAHQKIFPELVKNVDLIFSTGHETAIEILKITSRKAIVQPSGINDIFLKSQGRSLHLKRFQIITVANLYPSKNIDFILDIAKELKETDFVIVGDGPEKNVLQKKICKFDINNTKLIGSKTPAELKQLYELSDCFLLASLAEGTPTSALEAMACGLPIISSNAGGFNAIIKDFKNGFIIHNYNKNEYIKKICLLQRNVQLRMIISKNNQSLAKNYSWNIVAGTITNLTQECLNEKN